ncbi:MAG TPA: TonB-dependent receptor [Steroidobacteraceae bacterium]|nr:TonB-dependent receptor [Steroidobacteraceae bacterium]
MSLLAKSPLAVAIAAVLYPAATYAATTSNDDVIEEIMVTATRRSLNVQEVPQSITALSTEFIEKQALTNLYDLAAVLPSANIISSTPGRNTIVMRGIATTSSEYRIDSQVSVYLDEQPMTSISQQADVRLIDIERVESLPGPQGTIFGSSSQAGTIRYVTNKPDTKGFSSQVDLEVGSTHGGNESYDLSGWVNLPVNDSFALRAVGYWAQEGGYVDNVVGPTLMGETTNADIAKKDQNIYTTKGGRLEGLWTINDKWNLLLTGIYQRSDADGSWETDPALGDNKLTRFFDEYRNDKWYTTAATLKGDLGFAELSLTTSYFDRKVNYEWDNTNYAQWRSAYYTSGSYPAAYALYDTGTLHSTTFNWQKQWRWDYEARLTSQGDSKLQWMAGAFYEDVYDWWEYGAKQPGLETTNAWAQANVNACDLAGQGFAVACPLAPTDYYYYNKYKNEVKQIAFFGETSYELTDHWTITGGARWFEYNRDLTDIYNVPFGLPAQSDPDATGLHSTGVDNDMTFKAAIQYHFNKDVMLYGLYSEGFRLGGDNSPRAASTGEVPAQYGPDTLSNYEAGLKSEWLNHTLQLNVSVFLMKWKDIQLHFDSTSDSDVGAWWIEGNINGGKAEQKGIELSGTWHPTKPLSFSWSVFLADPKFTEDTLVPNSTDVYIAKGLPLPVSPKEKYWASVDYRFPHVASGEFWTRFSYSYQGETWDSITAIQDNNRELLTPPYKSGQLQFGFTSDKGWETALIVRNLFDDKGYNYLSGAGDGEFFGDSRWRYLRSLERPRSLYLSFTKKW